MATVKLPTLTLKKTNEQVIADACKCAKWIVNDKRCGYGRKGGAKYKGTKEYSITHSGGCHFCGSNAHKIAEAKKARLKNPEEWEYTYVCNTLVHACYAHAGVPSMLKAKGHSWWVGSYQKSKYWTEIKKPANVSDLKTGDVLFSDGHAMLYIGNGKIAEATSNGNASASKEKWAESIHAAKYTATRFKQVTHVFRFDGAINTTALIKYGEVSYRVKQWQAFLNFFNGDDVLKADGIFGDATLKYTKAFQTARKITADGIIGEDTLKEAQAYLDANTLQIPTLAEIKEASNYGIRMSMVKWAKEIAADNRYHYNLWTSEPQSHKCPICTHLDYKKDPKHFGWNCIGFGAAVWHHGGKLNNICKCGWVSGPHGNADKVRNMTDAEALKFAREKTGLQDVEVIRNKNGIPKDKWQAGDICFRFVGDVFNHIFVYIGNGYICDSTGSSGTIPNDQQIAVRKYKNYHAEIIFRYKGGHTYLQEGDKGVAVEKLQKALNYYGATLATDGIFGPKTKEAVEAYQKAHGLTVDGLAGTATFNSLGGKTQ